MHFKYIFSILYVLVEFNIIIKALIQHLSIRFELAPPGLMFDPSPPSVRGHMCPRGWSFWVKYYGVPLSLKKKKIACSNHVELDFKNQITLIQLDCTAKYT